MRKNITVITSQMNEVPDNFINAQLNYEIAYIKESSTKVKWIFKSADAAYRATIKFMEADVPFVRRVI